MQLADKQRSILNVSNILYVQKEELSTGFKSPSIPMIAIQFNGNTFHAFDYENEATRRSDFERISSKLRKLETPS